MGKKYITKSDYCCGIQCPKILWMNENKPEERQDAVGDSVLRIGKEVGELACQYFGEYTRVPFNRDLDIMASNTEKLIADGLNVIAEASFIYEDLFCSVDILVKNGDTFDLIEVKSATSIEEIYLYDASFQYYLLCKKGLPINSVNIMYINNQYVRNGELELDKLFYIEDVTDRIIAMQFNIPTYLSAIRDTKALIREPANDIDECCDYPYECSYKKYCSKHLPTPSVFDVSRMRKSKKYALYHAGVISFEDIIINQTALSDTQRMQVETAYYHYPDTVDRVGISEFVGSLEYPIYYLDFETFQQAIPKWDGINPYMQIPFQYSLHIQYKESGPLEHCEFLGEAGKDPRRALAEQLVNDIPLNVCSLAYNMGFEKGVIRKLAETYPDLSYHLMNIHDNMRDLMVPFQNQSYYSEKLQGSYSIKYVLPALCSDDPSLDYHNLDGIHNGGEAMSAYAELEYHTDDEIAEIRKNLLAYCCLDTLAMVKILEKLIGFVK